MEFPNTCNAFSILFFEFFSSAARLVLFYSFSLFGKVLVHSFLLFLGSLNCLLSFLMPVARWLFLILCRLDHSLPWLQVWSFSFCDTVWLGFLTVFDELFLCWCIWSSKPLSNLDEVLFTWASLVAQRLKASACNVGDLGSIPGKIPWRRKWQPTLVLLPGKSHEWRSLVGCSPWGR